MSKWISVKDRLPDEDEKILFLTNNKQYRLGKRMCKYWVCDNDASSNSAVAYITSEITHWMSLPEPPKEEQND